MGVGHYWWGEINSTHFDLLGNCSANTWREAFFYDWWHDNSTYWADPSVTFRSKMYDMLNWSHQRGIMFYISPDALNYTEWAEGSPDQGKADVIMNASGKGDLWISCYGEVIRELQPDIIDVMNEPPLVDWTSYNKTVTRQQFFEEYENFVVRAINAWKTIKPDMIFDVESCPWWDLSPLVANPLNISNVIYSYHYYYSYDGTPPPDWDSASKAYWAGNLTEAKQLLDQHLLNETGIGAALDKGMHIDMTETGACLAAPNALAFMQDMYDFCKTHDIGVLYFSLNPYPKAPTGLLNADWKTLNAMGELWSANMARQ
jgi:hypothetical protein